MQKNFFKLLLYSALSLSLLAGCGPAEPTTPEASNSPAPNGYVEIPRMTDDLIAPEESRELAVHYLPQGYAILESAGQAVLLGGCSKEDVEAVSDVLSDLDIERLNYIIVPSSQESRWSGVSDLREKFGKNLVVTSRAKGSTEYEQFKEDVGNMLLTVGAGSSFNVGTEIVHVIGPLVDDAENSADTSLVLWTECGEKSFLFADDASAAEFNSILASGIDIKARYIFLNSRGESTIPFAAVQLLSPWEFVVADDAVLPDFGAEEPANLHELNELYYSVVASDDNYDSAK